ncbi:MAG: YidC/Oxa1 family membrane protein insertase [Chthonomonadales bacterium]|nr:YidC/Oxa1 family membrane protein insertase [Chthonomonadales bacterium]
MRRLFPLTIVLWAMVFFAVYGRPRAAAQGTPQTPPGAAGRPEAPAAPADPLARAHQLEQDGLYQDALNEYNRIVREQRKARPEVAAEALYSAGRYAATKPTGLDQAHQMWRQLRDEFPKTAAARRLTTPTDNMPDGPMAGLEKRIDRRNSADFRYKMIDGLVKATGSTPAFSYALALILLAVAVKMLLLPLTKRQYASMREMQRMQPLVNDLKKKFKGQELQAKTMELYKLHGVNPLAGCLPALLQMPFLIGIYTAIREYEIAFAHGKFLWIGSGLAKGSPEFMGQSAIARNLAQPDVPLLALYCITNYVTMRMTPAQDPQQQQSQNMMALMTSVIFFWMFLSYKWSSAFVLYWLALNLFSIWQQYEYVYKPHRERQLSAVEPAAAPQRAEPARNGAGAPRETAGRTTAPQASARVRPRRKRSR